MRFLSLHAGRNRGGWAFRFLWLALVVVHLVPLIALSRQCSQGVSAEVLAKLAGIALSIAFFSAKAAGLRVVRVPCRWTGVVVFLTVVGVAHQNIRDELLQDDVSPIAATAWVAAALPAILRRSRMRVSIHSSEPGALTTLFHSAWRRLVDLDLAPWVPDWSLAYAAPRGPPAF